VLGSVEIGEASCAAYGLLRIEDSAAVCDPWVVMRSRGQHARFRIVWLDRESKKRRGASRDDGTSARDLARQLMEQGHGDIRYRLSGEREWRAVPPKGRKARRRRRETPFPPKAPKKPTEKKRSDALDKAALSRSASFITRRGTSSSPTRTSTT
jgi:hypothetical protein